jgi:hypothetical protein
LNFIWFHCQKQTVAQNYFIITIPMRMKNLLCLLLFVALTKAQSFAQNTFPNLDVNALVKNNFTINEYNKPYTVIIYGGVGCGYSKFLIENLTVLNECKDKCDIILIMDQAKDSITKHMAVVTEQYPTFSNTVLQYKLKKRADIFPQLLLFKNKVQIHHIVGIKEGMLTKTKQQIIENK